MTDVLYVYNQDIKEKKSAGYGAFHKKNGSKSKKCNFPSDYLSRKEKNKMNGTVSTLNLGRFYTWEEFKKFSTDFQVEYLQSLADNYTVGVDAIAGEVFGITGQSMKQYLVNHGVDGKVQFKGVRGSRVKRMYLHEAVRKQRQEDEPKPEEQPVQEETKATQETVEVKEEKKISTVLRSTIEMSGFDMNMIELMKSMYGDSEIRVTITVERL